MVEVAGIRSNVALGITALLLLCIIGDSGQGMVCFETNSKDPIINRIISQGVSSINLTWTSRWTSLPQRVENNSHLVGDHVILNASYNGFTEFSRIEMYFVSINVTISNTSRFICYDTYKTVGNSTHEIHVTVLNSLNESIAHSLYLDVDFGNWFTPSVIVNDPIELEDGLFNFTWSSVDLNADDVNFYQVWVSSDGGSSFYLVASNLTETYYVWDSEGYLMGPYFVRIRAFSVDLFVYPGPFISIPGDYWPGDHGDGYAETWSGDGPPRFATIKIDSPSDLSFFEGTLGQWIIWNLSIYSDGIPPNEISYTIFHNNVVYLHDSKQITGSAGQSISFLLEGFAAGSHNFTLVVDYSRMYEGINSDSVLVEILLSPMMVLIYFASLSILVIFALTMLFAKRGGKVDTYTTQA